MIAEVQVISNGGWNLIYLLVGGAVGMIGAVLMMVWQGVSDEREQEASQVDEVRRRRRIMDGDGDEQRRGR